MTPVAPAHVVPASFPALERLVELGVLSVFDRELALALAELSRERREEALLGVAFASAAVQSGHTCADIPRLAERSLLDGEGRPVEGLALPAREAWLEVLRTSGLVAVAGKPEEQARPLVLDERGRLYLARYHAYEKRLAHALLQRAASPAAALTTAPAPSLDRLFPPEDTRGALQRRAAEVFLARRLTVVSGGPGTGKTYTVSKVLAALQEQALAAGRVPYRVLLTAPTGKAAQRLGDTIRDNLQKLGLDALKLGIPTEASTLHRALGYQPAKPTRFRRNAANPLAYDVVVVDEASMVDLALMAKLVDAVHPEARLLLLGDKDQLASVEAGAILADIYGGLSATGGVPNGPLSAGLVHLTESHRFGDDGAIAALAAAINGGDVSGAFDVLSRGQSVAFAAVASQRELDAVLTPLLAERYEALTSVPPAERLLLLERYRVLCAHRRGPFGVEGVNALAVRELARRERLEPRGAFYDGRPVLVVANDYDAGLFNGDTGVLAVGGADADAAEAPLRAWFRGAKAGTLREVSPARLPRHETAFALSVHKSQGSEFDEVTLVLPERASPVLTRELVYTAVTRARRKVTIVGPEAVLRQAIAARVERASGLAERLWGA